MYKLELFTWVRSPYIWQTRKRANAPDIETGNCLQQVKGPWVLHVNTFYSWILLYISPVAAVNISILSVLYITHLLQLY